jgi:hypothetical protein
MALHSSQLGRGGRRDDRRRRLLAEDRSVNLDQPGENPSGNRPVTHQSENYGDAEFLQTQLRLTDMVPRRIVLLVLLPIAGAAAIAGLTMLYVAAPGIFHSPNRWPETAVLGGPGSLSAWFASLLLLMATFYAVVNYTVRRHRTDDYRGRYRAWLWAAFCCFLLATDVAAGLHRGLQEALVVVTGRRIVGDGTIWWLGPAVILMGFVGTRLLIDMWYCRLASAAIVLSAIAYLAALAPFFQVVHLSSEVSDRVLFNDLLLAGHLLLAYSMVLHARFVLMDAEGLLPRPAARRQAKSKDAVKSKIKSNRGETNNLPKRDTAAANTSDDDESDADESEDRWMAVDARGASGRPDSRSSSGVPVLRRVDPPAAASGSAAAQKAVSPSPLSSSPATASDDGKLSKADRKALKKKLLEERVKAEQRKAANW